MPPKKNPSIVPPIPQTPPSEGPRESPISPPPSKKSTKGKKKPARSSKIPPDVARFLDLQASTSRKESDSSDVTSSPQASDFWSPTQINLSPVRSPFASPNISTNPDWIHSPYSEYSDGSNFMSPPHSNLLSSPIISPWLTAPLTPNPSRSPSPPMRTSPMPPTESSTSTETSTTGKRKRSNAARSTSSSSRAPKPTRGPPRSDGLFRDWVFTINNPADTQEPFVWVNKAKFCTWQLEQGENGTPHLQGYVCLNRTQRFSYLKNLCPEAHWEFRKGTHEQAAEYCHKEEGRLDGPWEYGSPPLGRGTRSDLNAIQEEIKNGKSTKYIAENYFASWVRFHKAFDFYRGLCAPPRSAQSVTVVVYGPTRTGKSHAAFDAFPDSYWLSRPNAKNGGLWFDGYCGQECLVIDEFYGWISYDFLLRICDKWPLLVQTKGGTSQFNAKFVVITSNKAPENWYNYANFEAGYDPLYERISCIFYKSSRNLYEIRKSPSHGILDSQNSRSGDIPWHLVPGYTRPDRRNDSDQPESPGE